MTDRIVTRVARRANVPRKVPLPQVVLTGAAFV
jgi:hypothetical protein